MKFKFSTTSLGLETYSALALFLILNNIPYEQINVNSIRITAPGIFHNEKIIGAPGSYVQFDFDENGNFEHIEIWDI